jgi:ABC-2 type transport system permease protein
MRALRLAGQYFRVGAINELQYRVNFFVYLFQSALALGTGLAVLALVFGHVGELNGWSRPQLLAVMGVYTVMGGLIRTVIQPNMTQFIQEVRDGRLDYLLTKPADAQLLVSIRSVQIWQVVDVLSGLVVLVVAVVQLGYRIGPVEVLGFALALVVGVVVVYCFWLILTTVAFWVVRMEFVIELFEGVYQAGRWPVGIYPGWLRIGLTFLVPIAFAVTVPAEAITGRLGWLTLVGAVALAGGLLAVTRWFWRLGLRHYAGASA